ncbi:DUF805 domain-containing protein, partial [Phenylobacterium sp.]|uniref:DUF805 domain-containing protein n=1 Tax=Phenylobacterium sp. TaxID=1871053 RepID=UPI002E3158AB
KTLFLTADGRIGKRDFWIGFAILFGIGFVAGMIPVLGQIISLVLIYPTVCVFSKRLHDFGKTGWLYLAPVGITVVLMIVMGVTGGMAFMGAGFAGNEAAAAGSAMAGMGLIFALALLGFAVWVGFLLWVGLTNGDQADNRYGPPPVSLTGGTASPPTIA